MRILVITNSHKNFAKSVEVGEWIREGIIYKKPYWTVDVKPIGDGGDGTVDTVIATLGGKPAYIDSINPLNEAVKTKVGLIEQNKTAVMEISDLAGSAQLRQSEEWNTLTTSSYGVGHVIRQIARMNVDNIIIGLGGSIISDGGAGMAQALGAEYIVTNGGLLSPQHARVSCVDLPNISKVDCRNIPNYVISKNYIILADVNIPLLGLNGQAFTFGPQKKASLTDIDFIEEALGNWNFVLGQTFSKNFDFKLAGAAGGLGAGLSAFLNGEIFLGIEYILDLVLFDVICADYDWIITGEGKLDRTTMLGKCCYGIAHRCQRLGKRYFGIFGRVTDMIGEFAGCSIDASVCNLPVDCYPIFFSRQAIVDAASKFCDIIEGI